MPKTKKDNKKNLKLDEAKRDTKNKVSKGGDNYDELIDEMVDGEGGVNIGKLLEDIVKKALEAGSSDIHIEPREKEVLVRFRIDGMLRDSMTIDKKHEKSLIFKIKVASRLRTDEHFAPQDGKIRFEIGDQKLDTRISILPTTKGEKIVMRLLSAAGKSFSLESLGLKNRELEVVEKSYKRPYGLIIAAGPTGSGKTTTLYSILKILNQPDINITTIEDPVEYDIDGVNHVQVNSKANLTFATGLRSLLRQDPDIIMIGEIRDGETARIAINSALTGHLVLSTIHTNDSVTTIPRLIDMGIEDYLVASTVNVVIAQRLARRLCEKCRDKKKVTKKYKDEIMKKRSDIGALLKVGMEIYEAKGCKECSDTGYKGRVGLYEVLEVTKPIRDKVSDEATTDDIFELARKDGLETILEDGVSKLEEGITSVEEISRVTALKED